MKITFSVVIFIGLTTLFSCKPKGLRDGIYHVNSENNVLGALNPLDSTSTAYPTWGIIGLANGFYASQKQDTMIIGLYSQSEDSLILEPSTALNDSSFFLNSPKRKFDRQSFKIDGEGFYEERRTKNGEKVVFRYEWQGELNSLSNPTKQEASEPSE